jgi:hypothetical protein
MRRRLGLRQKIAGLTTLIAVALVLTFGGASYANVAGAAFTSDNPQGGTNACLNGPAHTTPSVNCNIYGAKTDVWINGGPSSGANSLSDGTYFFAVLDPGSQNDPNDGSAGNLSSPNDAYTNRTFSVSSGHPLGYTGSHLLDTAHGGALGNLIQLAPYNDTSNNGGVYILAICRIDTQPTFNSGSNTYDSIGDPVAPSSCKYDAFKVKTGTECAPNCGPGVAQDLSISKDATGSYDNTVTWGITKQACADGVTPCTQTANAASGNVTFDYTVKVTNDGGTIGGIKVTGTIVVTNPNPAGDNVSYDSVTDQLSTGQDCVVTNGGPGTIDGLSSTPASGQAGAITYECDITGSTVPTQLFNTATVNWSSQILSDGSVLVGNSASFTFPDSTTTPGGISFSQTPTSGNCITVTDNFNNAQTPDTLGTFCANGTDSNVSSSPAVSASYTAPTWTLTYSRAIGVTANTCTDYKNTATFSGAGLTSGLKQSDSATVTACGPAQDLTVSKDATGSYSKTYTWGITKGACAHGVTPCTQTVDAAGASVTFDYTVKVTNNGGTIGGIKVTGTIVVTNPNAAAVTIDSVTDKLSTGQSCTVTNGGSQSIAANSSTPASGQAGAITYECDITGSTVPTKLFNTATVNWSQQTLSNGLLLVGNSASFTYPDAVTTPNGISFSQTSTPGKCITVTDTFNGALTPYTLGTFCADGTKSGVGTSPAVTASYVAPTWTLTYSRTISVIADTCTPYLNTATFSGANITSGLKGSDSATVNVCGPVKGGLTMGFWQNSNGQTIINKYCGGTSGTSLFTYLTGFNPFKDLSSSKCSDIASYVYTVIKNDGGINCGGINCNTLLKAQMLATALNVYFSDPALGGNKIGAPLPIGGVKVDITAFKVAFNNQTCLKVSDMLTYAASQSTSGGLVSWYNQVRATQERAKSAFDAINNQVAFSCT